MRPTGFGRRQVAGVCHAEWREDVLLYVVVFGLAGDLLDQRAEQNEVDVGVAETRTGTRLERRGERAMNALSLVGSGPVPTDL